MISATFSRTICVFWRGFSARARCWDAPRGTEQEQGGQRATIKALERYPVSFLPRIHPTALAPTESWAYWTIETNWETRTMLVPISWLKEYVELKLPTKQLAD